MSFIIFGMKNINKDFEKVNGTSCIRSWFADGTQHIELNYTAVEHDYQCHHQCVLCNGLLLQCGKVNLWIIIIIIFIRKKTLFYNANIMKNILKSKLQIKLYVQVQKGKDEEKVGKKERK